MSLDAPFLSAFDRNQATKVAENKTNKNKEELKMKEGNTTAMLEQLRLREVALNSIFAKTGQKIRVKAVKVHKNNNERVGLEVRDKELPIVLTYYPTADDMMQPDVRLIERIVDVLREERDEVGLIVHEPDRDEFTANLVPEVMSVENAKWLEADGRP